MSRLTREEVRAQWAMSPFQLLSEGYAQRDLASEAEQANHRDDVDAENDTPEEAK